MLPFSETHTLGSMPRYEMKVFLRLCASYSLQFLADLLLTANNLIAISSIYLQKPYQFHSLAYCQNTNSNIFQNTIFSNDAVFQKDDDDCLTTTEQNTFQK